MKDGRNARKGGVSGETLLLCWTLLFCALVAVMFHLEGKVTVSAERPAAYAVEAEAEALVELNTATAEELMTLPGIGEALAGHIIDYRTEHGLFRTPEELMQVSGIGEKRFEGLKGLVTANGKGTT